METFVNKTDRYIVTIRPGKLSDEEFKKVLDDAARRFYAEIQKEKAQANR